MMIAGLIHALPFDARRGCNRREAASYVGVSPTHFDKLVRQGAIPGPLELMGRNVWDIRALDRALDTLSGTTASRPFPNSWDDVLQ